MKSNYWILAIVTILIIGGIFYLEGLKAAPTGPSPKGELEPTIREDDVQVTEDIQPNPKDSLYPKAPELVGIAGYLNTDGPITIDQYKGQVVLIDFWTYTCINCIRTLPFITSWDEKYRDEGLVIIGVHTPEFEFEKVKENVQSAIEKNGIRYPVVQDNDYLTWRAYKNRYWPRKYIIDHEGYVRYDHIGEGGYEETEKVIQNLLAEMGNAVDKELTEEGAARPFRQLTPELYAGHSFALSRDQDVANGGLSPGEAKEYVLPFELTDNAIHLEGEWMSNPDDLTAIGKAAIVLPFTAAEVNIVADAPSPQTVQILIDGSRTEKITIDDATLYNVYDDEYGDHILRIDVDDGFSFNAFTFG